MPDTIELSGKFWRQLARKTKYFVARLRHKQQCAKDIEKNQRLNTWRNDFLSEEQKAILSYITHYKNKYKKYSYYSRYGNVLDKKLRKIDNDYRFVYSINAIAKRSKLHWKYSVAILEDIKEKYPIPMECQTLDTIEKINDNIEYKMIFNRLIKRLTPREKFIIDMRYFGNKTLEEIGNKMRISRERVRVLEERAFERLRWACRKEKINLI